MKKVLIVLIVILFLGIFGFFLYYAYNNPFLEIKLIGDKEIILEVNSKYKDQGVEIKGTKNKYKVIDSVDISKLGEYKIIYQINVLKTTREVSRIVKVIDTTKPVITLKDSDVTIYEGDEYKEPGYNAIDNYDGDITKSVIVNSNLDNKKAGEYKITYEVKDSSNNSTSVERKVIVKEKIVVLSNNNVKSNINSGITYIKGILLVNKKYSLPSNYNPGTDKTAYSALTKMQTDASNLGYNLPLLSGFRSYNTQVNLYNRYVSIDGEAVASTYSAKPGHSEHQTGLAFDVGQIDDNFGNTQSGIWLANNCHKYGFIIRYLKGKEAITGYKYEPWHIRYVGVDVATSIYNSGITLEEYLGVN